MCARLNEKGQSQEKRLGQKVGEGGQRKVRAREEGQSGEKLVREGNELPTHHFVTGILNRLQRDLK